MGFTLRGSRITDPIGPVLDDGTLEPQFQTPEGDFHFSGRRSQKLAVPVAAICAVELAIKHPRIHHPSRVPLQPQGASRGLHHAFVDQHAPQPQGGWRRAFICCVMQTAASALRLGGG